jgi:hypothetical protein
MEAARIETATTASATGFPGSQRSPSRSSPIAMTPIARTTKFTWPSWPANSTTRSKKLCPPPATPKRLGSWVIMMVRPAPALNPTRMLSLISLTSALSRSAQASRQSKATVKPARLAICP